jgi:hypothetical protein
MSLKITSIADRGDPKKERLVMRVLADTDVGEYVAFRTIGDNALATTDVQDVFWFPDQPVRKGDYVVLYSRVGQYKTKALKAGSTSHFFYWGKAAPVWRTGIDVAVLLHVDKWSSLPAP